MADGSGPTEQDRSEGMASLSEPPYVRGAGAWLLGAGPRRHFQVTRRKGGIISSHHRNNGYVHLQNPRHLTHRHREQARLLQVLRTPEAALDMYTHRFNVVRLKAIASKLGSYRGMRIPKKMRY